eukprot:3941537-Rhodomonas_salina.5
MECEDISSCTGIGILACAPPWVSLQAEGSLDSWLRMVGSVWRFAAPNDTELRIAAAATPG